MRCLLALILVWSTAFVGTGFTAFAHERLEHASHAAHADTGHDAANGDCDHDDRDVPADASTDATPHADPDCRTCLTLALLGKQQHAPPPALVALSAVEPVPAAARVVAVVDLPVAPLCPTAAPRGPPAV